MLHLNDITLRIAGRRYSGCDAARAGRAALRAGRRNGSGKSSAAPDRGRAAAGRRRACGCRRGADRRRGAEAPGGEATPLEAVLAATGSGRRCSPRRRTAATRGGLAEITTGWRDRCRTPPRPAPPGILRGLGFDEGGAGAPLSSFSGGWRMRVALPRCCSSSRTCCCSTSHQPPRPRGRDVARGPSAAATPRTLIVVSTTATC